MAVAPRGARCPRGIGQWGVFVGEAWACRAVACEGGGWHILVLRGGWGKGLGVTPARKLHLGGGGVGVGGGWGG